MNRSKTKAAVKRAVRCADCGEKFDGWRTLQRHKRKSCSKSSWRFLCRECKAYFLSKIELNSHISAAHSPRTCETLCTSINACSINSSQTKFKGHLSSSEKSAIIIIKDSNQARNLKCKKVHKQPKKSQNLKNWKVVPAHKVAKGVGTLNKRVKDVRHKEHYKSVATCRPTVGSNPFSFTTSCAPDAQSFQFLCQSCLTVRLATYTELRQHEDWCARVRNSGGFLCLPCGRHYRSLGTLRRHADEYHKMHLSSEVTNGFGNPFLFSTTIALDAESHPHVCSSCLLVCFSNRTFLRRHEDWCGQCVLPKDGSKCNKCGRYFRTAALLELHTAADNCFKTDSTVGAIGDIKINRCTGSESLESDADQKAAREKIVHSVCPLCDVPFMSQYEQQVHFIYVHNLTASELKIKQSVLRHSRRGLVGTQVTCLDCDLMFSSRLELVQHKRTCTKEKKSTAVVLPIAPQMQSNSKKLCSVKDKNSAKKGNSPKADVETISNSTSGKSSAKCENQSEGGVTELSSSRAVDTVGAKKIPRGLLLNNTKLCNLIRRTGAKQIVLKPDGEVIPLGNGGQKISAINGKPVITKISVETHSSYVKKDSKLGSSGKSSAVPSLTVESKLLPASSGIQQSTLGDKKVVCSWEPKTDKCGSNMDLKSTAESLQLMSSEKNSGQTEDRLQPSCCRINHTVDGKQHQICQRPNRVARHKCSEAKSVSASAPKTYCNVDKQQKSTRKRSLQNNITDVNSSNPNSHSNAARGPEVKCSIVMKEASVSRSTRSKRHAHTKHHSVLEAVDLPTPASSSEIKVSNIDCPSNVTDGQQTLLEPLQLVGPVSSQLNCARTVTEQYQTRSVTHARVTSDEPVTKRTRYMRNNNNLSISSTALTQKGLASSAKTASSTSKTVKCNKHVAVSR